MTVRAPRPSTPRAGARDRPSLPRGVVMLFALIALVILLIGASAIVRSMNTSLANAGNLGFKRDLINQAERAIPKVLDLFQTGALSTDAARQTNNSANNYSATVLPSNAQGLPNALLNDTTFGTVGSSSNDITVADMSVKLRWVIDRMCANTGTPSSSHCTMDDGLVPMGGNGGGAAIAEDPAGAIAGAVPMVVIYRLSIRVDGPRQTQAFFQTTLAM